MRVLDVYLADELVGHITENHKGGRFEYAPEIAKTHAGKPLLSLAFPVKKNPFGESKTSNWFNGLLPEGARREQTCRSLDISTYDWIGLLSQIGWECAGAVRIFDQDSKHICKDKADYESISDTELAEKLSNMRQHLPNQNSNFFRMSLGGFQEKLCVKMPAICKGASHVSTEDVMLPVFDAPSTHILKPENTAEYPGAAESEAWAMTAASFATKTSRVALLDIQDAPPALVVQRFDRVPANNSKFPLRTHQEDACQALGLAPQDKYANTPNPKGDDPTYLAIVNLLCKFAENPQLEMRNLLEQLTVNLALGNWDAHAKNIAFLYQVPTIPTLAPLFDVVPIAEVEPRTEFASMRVNGQIRVHQITRADVVAEAQSWGMSASCANTTIDEVLSKLEEGALVASEMYPSAAARHKTPTQERIRRLQ